MSKEAYIAYIRQAAQKGREGYAQAIEQWRAQYNPQQFFGIYTAPGSIPVQAHLEGFLYDLTQEEEYAIAARQCLLDLEPLTAIVTKEQLLQHPEYEHGVPAMDASFQSTHFSYGYRYIRDSQHLSSEDHERIQRLLASSIHATLVFPEWGAHNRAMLRVWAAELASTLIHDRTETSLWQKICHDMAEDSIGHWSIEDAQAYLDLWLIACIAYSELQGSEDAYYAKAQTRYYFDYITRMITSYGQVPDFGDSSFNGTWYIWVAILEKGAAVYRSGEMKYAARKLFEFAQIAEHPDTVLTPASFLTLACQWMDETIVPVQPSGGSEEVLEDLIGKKIAFRSGWHEDDTYLLLNYRDEGDYSWTARNYLRTSIPVQAEKMHHGHSDENAIVLLASQRNILLHDGGYREQLPNGKYRADLYHNRLVFRSGALVSPAEQRIYDQLHDQGYYRPVRTEKLSFKTFGLLDYSRTRLHDPGRQLIWDRNIVYLKEQQVFILVDWVQSQADQTLAIGNLWHSGQVITGGSHYFDTCVPTIHRHPGCQSPYRNRDEMALLIEFPDSARFTGHDAIKRNYGQGEMIYEAASRTYHAGQQEVWITVLTPHARTQNAATLVNRVSIQTLSAASDTLSLAYTDQRMQVQLAFKLDLSLGLQEEAAYAGGPRYEWPAGRISYSQLHTDADFAFVANHESQLTYGLLNGCGLTYEPTVSFLPAKRSVFGFDTKEWHFAHHKRRSWEDTLPL